ncbi:MAG: hypothetical protein HYZ90_06895 [Candidatus Omnitrophica bacterium]|nr:hypothetical protein [Candidatus Omnitrophota bacterium]
MRWKFFFWLLTCLGVFSFLGLVFSLRSYHLLTREELVAAVRVEAAPKGSAYGFFLEVTPVSGSASRAAWKFPMHGDQWAIGGEILKWHPWAHLVGFQTCHKLTRVSSRYQTAESELSRPRSAHDLQGGSGLFWGWLHRHGGRLPFVEAVYGNAAYIPARPGGRFGVYVTPSGYLIKPLMDR